MEILRIIFKCNITKSTNKYISELSINFNLKQKYYFFNKNEMLTSEYLLGLTELNSM